MSEQRWPEQIEYLRARDTGEEWFETELPDDFQAAPLIDRRTYIPAESVQAVAEQLREGTVFGLGPTTHKWVNELADQLTSLCNRGSNDAT